MSGGALDYVYGRVSSAAVEIRRHGRRPLHLAFAEHLEKVADALQAMEWLMSGDTSDGTEDVAIRAVLSGTAELDAATENATAALMELQAAIKRAKGRAK